MSHNALILRHLPLCSLVKITPDNGGNLVSWCLGAILPVCPQAADGAGVGSVEDFAKRGRISVDSKVVVRYPESREIHLRLIPTGARDRVLEPVGRSSGSGAERATP